MNQQPSDPAIISTTQRPRNQGTLTFRNWWRNGAACTFAVVVCFLIVLNLFEPWEADVRGASYTTSETDRGTKTTWWHQGVDAKGQSNAFSRGKGWTTLLLIFGTLWVCSTPRPNWGAFRWLPLLSGVIVAWMVFLDLRELQREWDAFNARLTTKAVVTLPPAMQWAFILSVLLAVSGAFLLRAPKATRQDSEHDVTR